MCGKCVLYVVCVLCCECMMCGVLCLGGVCVVCAVCVWCVQRLRRSIQSAKSRLGTDCDSYLKLLNAKFRLKLKKVGKNHRAIQV